MHRAYLLEAKAAIPLPTQIAAALAHGFKSNELNSEFGSHRVYVDRRRPGEWLDKLTENLAPADVVHVHDLSLLGVTEAAIGKRLAAIGAKAATVKVMSSGIVIKPASDIEGLLAAMRDARKVRSKRSVKAMNAARKANGKMGGKRKEFTDEQIELCRQAWLLSHTQAEVVLRAEKLLGRTIGYTSIFRWAQFYEWPARGSGPRHKPVKRKKRRARR